MKLALVVLTACGMHHAEPPVAASSGLPARVVIHDAETAKAHAGTRVIVSGDARDAKLAAAIVNPGFVVYCLGLDTWPSEVSGQPVTARGRLEQTDEFTASSPADSGTGGPVWVLRECQYDAPN